MKICDEWQYRCFGLMKPIQKNGSAPLISMFCLPSEFASLSFGNISAQLNLISFVRTSYWSEEGGESSTKLGSMKLLHECQA